MRARGGAAGSLTARPTEPLPLFVSRRIRELFPGGWYTRSLRRRKSPQRVPPVSQVTQILSAIKRGDRQASTQLLPLVYDELRQLAAHRLAHQPPGQTLQPTALVHEAYLRLVGDPQGHDWDSRGHFFAAAAEAMRRILVERARRQQAVKHGGGKQRIPLEEFHRVTESPEDLLDLHDALTRFSAEDPEKARLVELRFFAGLSTADAAAALGTSVATAERWWTFARAWLYTELQGGESPQ